MGVKIDSFCYLLESDKGLRIDLTDYYDLQYTNDKETLFHVYDANLHPANDFAKWNPKAIAEVEAYVREKFKGYGGVIFIDSYEINVL